MWDNGACLHEQAPRRRNGPAIPTNSPGRLCREATGQAPPEPEDTRNPAAVALSKLGASKGGKARAKKLSKAKRTAIAKKAARARWGG